MANPVRSLPAAVLAAVLWSAPALAAAPLSDSQEHTRKLGNTLEFVTPAAAVAVAYLLGDADPQGRHRHGAKAGGLLRLDGSPRHDLALAFGRSILATEALKLTVDEQRPDGGDHSFPSGHTSIAFTGAEFIRKECAWWWGVPAYGIATFVGYSRVRSREHYTHDVLAGALIGILSNHDFRELHTRHGTLNVGPAAFPADDGRPAVGLQFSLDY